MTSSWRMSTIRLRWFEVRAEGAVACSGTPLGIVEAIARRLEAAGLRTIADSSHLVMGYRDAPPQTRSLGQVGAEPLLAHRVRELRVWVDGPRVLRYEASLQPDVFEVFPFVGGAGLLLAAWPAGSLGPAALAVAAVTALLSLGAMRVMIARHKRELRALVERAIRDALVEDTRGRSHGGSVGADDVVS